MSSFRVSKSALIILLLAVAVAAPALAEPALDIRPGECPNYIDRSLAGHVPMVLISDYGFPVSRLGIEPGTLNLHRADGVGGSDTPLLVRRGHRFADVASQSLEGECPSSEMDGIPDLLLRFGQRRIVQKLQLGSLPLYSSIEICLSGMTRNGAPFSACDEALISDFRIIAEEPDDDVILLK
jgi:hypothetical protein